MLLSAQKSFRYFILSIIQEQEASNLHLECHSKETGEHCVTIELAKRCSECNRRLYPHAQLIVSV